MQAIIILYLYLIKDLNIKCIKCEPCLGRIPNSKLNYSDHEGLQAEFEIKLNDFINEINYDQTSTIYDIRKENLLNALKIIETSLKSILKYQIVFLLIGFLSFLLLFLFNYSIEISAIKNIFLTSIILFSIWFSLFDKRIESNNLKSIKSSMEILLNLN